MPKNLIYRNEEGRPSGSEVTRNRRRGRSWTLHVAQQRADGHMDGIRLRGKSRVYNRRRGKNSYTFADGSFALMSRWEMKLLPTLDLRKAVSTSTCSLISLGFFREYSDIRLGFIKKWHVFPLCFIKKLYLCSTSLECGVWPFARPIQARRSPAHLMRSCLLLLTRPHVP